MLGERPKVLLVGECAMADARGLLARHYASGMPARVCRVLGAWLESDGAGPRDPEPMLIGVLTVSHPTLNDRWRGRAWPGVFEIADKRQRACALNARVRRISRVVVSPRFRGMGIATALVRAYLRRPLTTHTEVVAAMGDFCGCFAQAGMRAVECTAIARDVALANRLQKLRIAPESLADECVVRKLVSNERFVRAIRMWANAGGGTRKSLKRADAVEVNAPVAARAVVLSGEKSRVWVSEENAERGMRSGRQNADREARGSSSTNSTNFQHPFGVRGAAHLPVVSLEDSLHHRLLTGSPSD